MRKPARLQQRIRELRIDATELVRRGNHRQALFRFLELEALDPRDPDWPLRAAQSHRALGEKLQWVRAVARAAELHAHMGALEKAITAWKLILSVEPEHAFAQRRLAELQAPPKDSPAEGPCSRGARSVSRAPGRTARPRASLLAAGIRPGVARAPREGKRLQVNAGGSSPELDAKLPKALLERGRPLCLEAGLAVFQQNDAPDTMYAITRGSVVVIEEGPPARELYQLGAGDFFGEAAVLSDDTRSVTVETCERTELVAIDRAAVQAWLAEEHSALVRWQRLLCQRLLADWSHTSLLFAGMSSDERRLLAARLQFVPFKKDQVLIEQGTRSRGAFLLACGRARVVHRAHKQDRGLASLGAGDVCGEMSLLSDELATASVVGASDGFALMLTEEDFRKLCEASQQFSAQVSALSAERRRLNRTLLVPPSRAPTPQYCMIRPPPRGSGAAAAQAFGVPTVPRFFGWRRPSPSAL
ncbi:MAG: cyclic nucleotide-binding domain-containing protein [Myxococcota bacterium]